MLLDRLTDADDRPINFCDLRTGGLRKRNDRLEDVLERLHAYPEIEAIAVNVFAGVTDLQEFAELFVTAYRKSAPTYRLSSAWTASASRRLEASSRMPVCAAWRLDDLVELLQRSPAKGSPQVDCGEPRRARLRRRDHPGTDRAGGRVLARRMLDYGTPLVAGVVPGRSGSTVEGIPVFDTVYEARAETGSRCTVAFLPPTAAADGLVEAAEVASGSRSALRKAWKRTTPSLHSVRRMSAVCA